MLLQNLRLVVVFVNTARRAARLAIFTIFDGTATGSKLRVSATSLLRSHTICRGRCGARGVGVKPLFEIPSNQPWSATFDLSRRECNRKGASGEGTSATRTFLDFSDRRRSRNPSAELLGYGSPAQYIVILNPAVFCRRAMPNHKLFHAKMTHSYGSGSSEKSFFV